MTKESNNNVVALFPNAPTNAINLYEDGIEDEEFMSEEEAAQINALKDETQIQTLAMVIVSELGKRFEELGLDPHNQQKDFCLITEAIVSKISSHYERSHPLQELADAVIAVEDSENILYRFVPPKMTYLDKPKDKDDE